MPYIANDVFWIEKQQLIMITGLICPEVSYFTSNGFNSAVSSNGSFVLQIVSGWELSIRYSPGLVPAIIFRWENPLYGRNETTSILNNISDRSLVLLDEIGRGTST
jgi:DNA mismatch repair protein MutS